MSVEQTQRTLEENVNYIKDNSDDLLNFYKELKPYHTKIREYNVIYDKVDSAGNYVTDFDLPPYYDNETNSYIAPHYTDELTLLDGPNWINNYPYAFWVNEFRLFVKEINIIDGGDYTSAPDVIIVPNSNDIVTTLYKLTGSSDINMEVESTAGIYPGMFVKASGINKIVYVASVDSDTSITLSDSISLLLDNTLVTFTYIQDATAKAVLVGNQIGYIEITNKGSGYRNTPTEIGRAHV